MTCRGVFRQVHESATDRAPPARMLPRDLLRAWPSFFMPAGPSMAPAGLADPGARQGCFAVPVPRFLLGGVGREYGPCCFHASGAIHGPRRLGRTGSTPRVLRGSGSSPPARWRWVTGEDVPRLSVGQPDAGDFSGLPEVSEKSPEPSATRSRMERPVDSKASTEILQSRTKPADVEGGQGARAGGT